MVRVMISCWILWSDALISQHLVVCRVIGTGLLTLVWQLPAFMYCYVSVKGLYSKCTIYICVCLCILVQICSRALDVLYT